MSLTVPEAAKQWLEARAQRIDAERREKAAAAVLKPHLRKRLEKGLSPTYRGRIGYALSIRRRLDTARVKAELGDRLGDFEVPSEVETLSPLK